VLETSQNYNSVTLDGHISYCDVEDERFDFPNELTMSTSVALLGLFTSLTTISTTRPYWKVEHQNPLGAIQSASCTSIAGRIAEMSIIERICNWRSRGNRQSCREDSWMSFERM
jgi:hypothetical protein